jgi:cell pole-organizing protein PopZ
MPEVEKVKLKKALRRMRLADAKPAPGGNAIVSQSAADDSRKHDWAATADWLHELVRRFYAMKKPIELINDLAYEGGAIVSSNDCSEMEIADAQATGRFAVDAEAFGYVRRTKEWLALQKAREIAHPNTDGRYSANGEPRNGGQAND